MQKLGLLSIISTLSILIVIILTIWIYSSKIKSDAKTEIEALVNTQLAALSNSAYNYAKQLDVQIDERLTSNIEYFKNLVRQYGGFSLSGTIPGMKATNQFTKKEITMTIPGLAVGGKQIPFVKDKNTIVVLVDEISKKFNVAATIFVRMNEEGDMLRVATSVLTKEGNRAVGTYIPRTMPDGSPNKVVSTVLQGNDYIGSAFVVDRWYQTKYSPIKDGNGKVIGMIFVGISLEDVEGLKQAFYEMTFGKSGYVGILIGSGDRKGEYFVSHLGKRDGENVWEAKDPEGKLVIQKIIKLAKETPEGTTSKYSYFWKNPDENEPREKIALVQYFKDFDWVIATTAYLDEMYKTSETVQAGITGILIYSVIFGILITLLAMGISFVFARNLTNSINKVTQAADLIASGDLSRAIEIID